MDKETEAKRRIGDGTPGPGRPKGSQNKATTAVRESITAFVENNASKVQELFDKVAKDSPAKALDLYTRLAEFVIPKRNRTEIEGEIGLKGQLNIYD